MNPSGGSQSKKMKLDAAQAGPPPDGAFHPDREIPVPNELLCEDVSFGPNEKEGFQGNQNDIDQECGKVLFENLPMSDQFMEEEFYVRDCYRQYYDYISASLANGFYQISLTGTPGIGKSIFYIYFFQRYRTEFPKATIVTASFTMNSKLKQCIRYGPGDILGVKFSDIRELEADIYLYDGPPEMEPGPRKKWFPLQAQIMRGSE